jgi:RNA polymerase sigma-70 factor, ECF subfamily
MSAAATSEWSEIDLIQGMLAGERVAWSAFHRRYDGLIYAAIDRILRSFPALSTQVEREEVRAMLLSSLLARDMHKLRVFEFGRGVRLSTWVSLLAANAARDHVRAAFRRPSPMTATAASFESIEDESSGPLANLLTKEAMGRVACTVDQLSLKDRKLIQLLFIKAQAPEQVAAEMNISIKTVYTKKHKLIHRLQQALSA